MGIALKKRGRIKNRSRKWPQSTNIYLKLLVRLYRFLARRTNKPFNKQVLKRLMMSRKNRPPVSVSRIHKLLKNKPSDRIIVVVSTVTNDERFDDNKFREGLTVCAMRFTKTARTRIESHNGKCLTFDQLAVERPLGSNTWLIMGRRSCFKSNRYFAGKPYVRSKGRKFEKGPGSKIVKRKRIRYGV